MRSLFILSFVGLMACQPTHSETSSNALTRSYPWKLMDLNEKAGNLTIEFHPDGKFNGTGPCNNFFGSYSLTGAEIIIGPIASTRMACDALQSEYELFTALQTMTQLQDSGPFMTLTNANGDKMNFATPLD